MFRNKAVLLNAANEIGVHEDVGTLNNERVVEYHRYANKDNDNRQPDSVPWCASFIAFILETVGMGSTNSMMARSYEHWGVDVSNSSLPGDLVVFWRSSRSSGLGHVAVLVKETRGHVYCLGGNQNDEVNITRYSKNRLSTIRRSSKVVQYSPEEIGELYCIAEKILQDRPVEKPGRVT